MATIDRCGCDSWKENISKIEGAMFMMANHGVAYNGEIFNFCPWCGKELLPIEKEKGS